MKSSAQTSQSGFLVIALVLGALGCLIAFAAIGTLLYIFLVQPHKVSGNAMYPTLKSGEYFLTNKVTYRSNPPQRGDIIVFKNPQDDTQDFLKRVIGLPGEKVKIENCHVFINDQPLEEEYLPEVCTDPGDVYLKKGEVLEVPSDSYVALGDNRPASSDTRHWGLVPKENIIGKYWFSYSE